MKKEVLIFLMVLFGILGAFLVSSLQEGYCATAELTDISPTSVKIGEEFTVGILIDNCGDKSAQGIVFELKDVSPYIEVKESLKKDIGDMGYPNSDRFSVYHMKVLEDASPGEYLFNYKLTYNSIQKIGYFTVTVIGEEAELSIASKKTEPVLPYLGDKVELTLRIENYGKGDANSVKITADHPFQGIKESFIGTLDPSEDGPAIFTFIADKEGEFEFPVTISYSDDFGNKEITKNVNLIILVEKFNWIGLILSLFLVALVVWFVSHYFRTKRKKDSIIQQLLEGKPHHEDKKLKKSKK